MEAFPTGDAVFFPSGFHMGGETVLGHLENIRSWHTHAGLNAAETHHASIKPLPDQRSSVGDGRKFSFLRGILVFFDSEFKGSILELALSPGVAHRTV
jgi:hypothetical protein